MKDPKGTLTPDDERMLDVLQGAASGYFLKQTHPRNGLVADTSRPVSPVSIAVVDFALSTYPVVVEPGRRGGAPASICNDEWALSGASPFGRVPFISGTPSQGRAGTATLIASSTCLSQTNLSCELVSGSLLNISST